jgi:hypothetical protein
VRRRRFAAITSPLLLLALAALFVVASPARAIICVICPPPFGVALVVDTTVYPGVNGDGKCSLDEAINAANGNSNADASSTSCDANASQAGATDGISFTAGVTTINITSTPPAITTPIAINGGASRVELHGPGTSANGLYVTTAASAGSSIRNLVINGFGMGIYLDHTSGITIAGNYIGTNRAGSAAVPNGQGIYAYYGIAQVGGLNGLTPGGPCAGDCNLISGNTGDGIHIHEFGGGLIEGNFAGTDVTGTSALGNGGSGIHISYDSPVTIGGTASGAGNLTSGNTFGIEVEQSAPVIQGNFIGANVNGNGAIPNTTTGIYVHQGNHSYPFTIGGLTAGAGNVISGNTHDGVALFTADRVAVYGNLIGTQVDGTTPLPNGGGGVALSSSTHSNVIGGTGAGQANVVAFNGLAGVGVFACCDYYNQVRGNSIHENTGKGIFLADDQNHTTSTPAITGVNPIHGTACANCTIDVYSDADGQGKVYEGTVTADGAGNWTFSGSPAGPNVTATATSASLSTSEFSAPYTLPATPSPTPTSTPTSTATATGSSTPTPSGQTASPTPTTTATPRPTHSPTPTPTHTASATLTQGDFNCDGDVGEDDFDFEIEYAAGLNDGTQPDPCPDLGAAVPAAVAAHTWGDVNCDGHVNASDALYVLAHIAGIELHQQPGCVTIGHDIGH